MCLLVVNSSRKGLTQDHFKNAWENNSDGFGMAYVRQKSVYVYKNLKSADESFKMYRKLRDKFSGAFILHFRLATSGLVDLDNCHPFEVGSDLVFAHNGIIPLKSIPAKSDTSAFRDLLKELPRDFLKVPSLRTLVTLASGNSKLAFLNARGEVDILNDHLGEWSTTKEDWFSNNGHLHSARAWSSQKRSRWYRDFWHDTPEDDASISPYERCTLCDKYTNDTEDIDGDLLCAECVQLMGVTWTREKSIHEMALYKGGV